MQLPIVALTIVVLSLRTATGSPAPAPITYRALAPIDSLGRFQAEWAVQSQTIRFNLIVETLGFIGFGFSLDGAKAGSDIVVGGVWDTNGTAYLTDRHGVGFNEPPVDSIQNYQLLSASQNETHTSLAFERALNTGDTEQDVVITNSNITLLWAIGAVDELEYHFSNRGRYVTNLLE